MLIRSLLQQLVGDGQGYSLFDEFGSWHWLQGLTERELFARVDSKVKTSSSLGTRLRSGEPLAELCRALKQSGCSIKRAT